MAKGSTTFEHRQRVLALLHDQPGIRVGDSARLLRVSEGTIRNDLNALAKAGQLERVRGGVPRMSIWLTARLLCRVFACMSRPRDRWPAGRLNSFKTAIPFSSTRAHRSTKWLNSQDRRGLTVVTNGKVGRKLAQESSHTVMLLGGVLNSDGVPVTDLVRDAFLQDLHTCPTLMVCDAVIVTNYVPVPMGGRQSRIGFANLGENTPFSIDIRRGIERAVQAAGNVELMVADNQLNGQTAVQIADRFIAKKPDLIEY